MEFPLTIQSLFTYFKTIHSISPEAERALYGISFEIETSKNKHLHEIGQTCKTYYFVSEGLARIFYLKDGTDVTEYFAHQNDMIIRAESLFTGRPSKKAIQALENTVFIGIPASKLEGLFDTYPDLERLFRKILEASFVAYVNRMESLQFHTAEERYNQLVKDYPRLLENVSLKHIASYLGITQVSLSRIRSSNR
ncbi:Crp/Fnr family transcriptional regulator [Algoriphagus lutimaris]|uniref:Crp/Fnr family transcriptional regulator n=1 Tax=Algoriphagus lutimaris TaxID=613197 RepID=UPI00196B4B08|nr:Crp/Fnr family transcriptional regulator [Algoriphagus lutimaris]MBN3518950.1 Crp/Fnr family transcriptional regulator [Algoriphagus lutimaris]